MPFLLEARIAYALHGRGVKPDYEYQTGVGDSSADFRVVGNSETWLIEVVKIGESAAAKAATRRDGIYASRVLKTSAPGAGGDEAKQSPEGELLLVEQKIAKKVVRGRNPIRANPEKVKSMLDPTRVDLIQAVCWAGGQQTWASPMLTTCGWLRCV